MSFSKDENSALTSENMEEDDKVKIEETSINLSCIKEELDDKELEFEEKPYKIALTLENMFGQNSIEQRNNGDSLIGFSDGDVIMKTESGAIKVDIKEEIDDLSTRNVVQSYCNQCDGNYQGYCLNCSSLSHILNNVIPNLHLDPVLNSTPINILEIREVSRRQGVFVAKTLPKGITLGPFEGVVPIESTTHLQWKIKDNKPVNVHNGNWMKYIESVSNHLSKNLDIFQLDGALYFETNREIQEGEELLVYYSVEKEMSKFDIEEEFYLIPVKKEEYPKVYACTLCCFGFHLERCLVEHKSKCPRRNHVGSMEDIEIIQCSCCKVWLEKQEHLESHMLHCLRNCQRWRHNISDFLQKPTDKVDKIQGNDAISTLIYGNESHLSLTNVIHSYKTTYFSEKKHKCPECSYRTDRPCNLKLHVNAHNGIKPFECGVCKKKFSRKKSVKLHIKNLHSNTNKKEYKCSKCSYQTNQKVHLKRHLNTHMDIKPFECGVCKKRFTQKIYLKMHIRDLHSNTNDKEYKCSECSYQTNRKHHLKSHLNIHNDIKAFECDICKKQFALKYSLRLHIKNKHSNTNKKEYKCSDCLYQTNRQSNFRAHLNTHIDIKPFECDVCKKRMTQKIHLKKHIQNKHLNMNESIYK